jgi:hypothetical protein
MSSHTYKTYLCMGLGMGLGLLLLAVPATAQMRVGEDLSLTLNGTVGVGYDGSFGNTQLSNHSTGVNGDLNLNGFFHNPNFLNFFVRPMYNRSQENSGSQSLTNATNISTGAGIFSGSHFPGQISYGKTLNSTGTFGLPELQGFTTHGNSTQFGIGWSELLPSLPPLVAQYSQTTSDSTVFGTNDKADAKSRNFNLSSTYSLRGWLMSARFNDVYTRTSLPSFLTAGEFNIGDTNSKTFFYNTNHKLPMRGSVALNYSYGNFHGDGNGTDSTGSNNTVTGNVSLIPVNRLTTNVGVQYNSSLSGMVEQQLIGAGGIAPQINFGSDSHSLAFYNFDTVQIVKNLSASFDFTHTEERVYGRSLSANHFSGIVNYHFEKPLWGAFTFYAGVNDQSSDAGHQGTGLVAGANFDKRIKGIEWGAGFSYAQDVQTVLATEVTSDYSYLVNARKRMTRHWLWNANFHGFHTGISPLTGSSSHSEGYSANLTYRNYAFGGNYNRSFGTALLTAGGLIAPPSNINPVLGGDQFLLVNGSSYSFNATANPVRRWTVSSSYSRALSNTQTPVLFTAASAKVLTAFTQVQFRKISAGGGYTHLIQAVGAVPGTPADYSSFFVGIQRWFHPF